MKTPTPLSPVGRRHVVHISGFEPIGVDGLDRRIRNGVKRFGELWGAATTVAGPEVADDGMRATWEVEAKGRNWTTRTRYSILRWDHLMAPYVDQPWLSRVVNGYRALFEFARTGTIRRYFKANVRYGLFVIYPFLTLGGFILGGIIAAVAAALLGVPWPWLTVPLIGLAVFALLMRFLGGYFFLDFALADWAYAADLARRDIAPLEDVLQRFSREARAGLDDAEADEVVLSGVSLGAVMMVEAISRAYDADPALPEKMAKASFLTVGSSILKIGLHPAASELRRVVGRVGAEPSVFWAEYQAKVDPINFYKTDPVADLGNTPTGKPVVRQIRLRDMMSAEGYRKAQRSSIHLHRQFVMPNAKRYFYDFYQIGFGPLSLRSRVALGKDAAAAFAADGAFQAKARPAQKTAMAAGE